MISEKPDPKFTYQFRKLIANPSLPSPNVCMFQSHPFPGAKTHDRTFLISQYLYINISSTYPMRVEQEQNLIAARQLSFAKAVLLARLLSETSLAEF